jgi:hypothetical protein
MLSTGTDVNFILALQSSIPGRTNTVLKVFVVLLGEISVTVLIQSKTVEHRYVLGTLSTNSKILAL